MHHNFIFLSISFNFSALVLGLTPSRSNVIHSDAIRSDAIRSDASSDVPFYSKCKGLARGNFWYAKKPQKNSTKSDRLSQIHKSGVQKKEDTNNKIFWNFKRPTPKIVFFSKKKMNPCLSKEPNPKTPLNLRHWSHDFSYQVTWTTWEPEPDDPEEEEDPPQDPLAAAPMPRCSGVKK